MIIHIQKNKMKKSLLLIFYLISININSQIKIYTEGNIVLDTITIKESIISGSYKAKRTTPFSFKNINYKDIELRGRENEPISLLQYTPSVTYNTDNGLFTGYCYYRLRGIDQTRINSSLNGIPLNEPEDQGIYYNNYPNFLQTISDIQIIRGAGISKNGVSCYGGSINFDMKNPNETSNELSLTHGSYNTINISTNLNLKRGFIRSSFSKSDGYKYNSNNNSFSTFYGYNFTKSIKLYGFIGKQFNNMAWVGNPIDSIKKDNRYNSNKEWEKDEFLYIHNQLHLNNIINKNIGYNFILYYTHLNGWYNMDMGHFGGNFGESLYKLSLNSNWIGTILNYIITINDFNSYIGLSSSIYKRTHKNYLGDLKIYEIYNENYGKKIEIAPHLKSNYKLNKINLYGDIQYRFILFNYYDSIKLNKQYNFLNWSLGSTYVISKNINTYFGIGKSNREPTRTDLFGGYDEYYNEYYSDIKPESVIDYELGIKLFKNNLYLNTNVYLMNFNNEIVLNGKVGPNAIIIHSNVAKSYRKGLEIDFNYKLKKIQFINITNISKNQINQNNIKIIQVLTPSFLSTNDIVYLFNKNNVGLSIRYNGESYIDFTNQYKLPSFYLVNLYSNFNINNNLKFNIKLNNIFNKLYYTNGIMGYDENPLYFQHARFNFLFTLILIN